MTDEQIGALSGYAPESPLAQSLNQLGEQAVQVNAPMADNTTAVALRWLGP
jgi:hypothetical protein